MKWLFIGLFIYILVGLGVNITQCKQLIIEETGGHYDSKDVVRFKVYIVVVLLLSILVWPIVLKRTEKLKSQRLYVIRDVTDRFTHVSKERGENLEAIELSNLIIKFIKVYEEFGFKMYDSHLKYELEKFRAEGLREDYKESV